MDPGESTGLSVWEDDTLILGFTLEMGVVDLLLHAIFEQDDSFIDPYPEAEEVYEAFRDNLPIRVVCEDWRLYPWVMYTPDGRATHALDFDQCRTARLIGALRFICRLRGVPFILQGADIKETAVAGGAENFYYKPLHENRHQNDAIQHGVFYLIIEERRAPKDGRA